MTTALPGHEFAYRALQGQSRAFDYLGKKLATKAEDSIADLEDGLRFLKSDLPFIQLATENQMLLNETGEGAVVSADMRYSMQEKYDETLGRIAQNCALLRFGFGTLKRADLLGEVEHLVQEYRKLHARCRPELPEDEMDEIWNEEWVPPQHRKRMPWGLRYFPSLYRDRLRYQNAGPGITAMGLITAMLLLPLGPWFAVAGFFVASLGFAALIAAFYAMDEE